VFRVVYLIFTEGSTAFSGSELIRVDLAQVALRLARMPAHLVPDDAKALGLLALLELTTAQRVVLPYDILLRLAPSPVEALNRAVGLDGAGTGGWAGCG
jgi:predicted RNA polymerase sigma factor